MYPSIRRVVGPEHGTALNVLVGDVANLDRAQPDEGWVDRFLALGIPSDWLEEVAPEAMAAAGTGRVKLQQEARERESALAALLGEGGGRPPTPDGAPE